ncbi:MAG: hypothetical protein ABSC65_09465 [Acidobacteriaceae bacterium]|jgi:hypothetical protein
MLIVEDKALQSQVERILHSDEFRTSEVLRRLFKFLAEKTVAGEADHLKEYAVAIDGLGKHPSYDPRQNSAVRIQVGRLRQKLAEYYRNEGKHDDIVVDLPKGRFKLTYEQRCTTVELPAPPPPPITPPLEIAPTKATRPLGLLLWVGLALAMALVALYLWRSSSSEARTASSIPGWTPELRELWGPLVDSKLPVILAIEDPLFIELKSAPGIYYRDRSLNQWKDVVGSPAVAALRTALNHADIKPSRYYTAFGEVDVSFLLGKLLGSRERNFCILKTSQLSWRQLADNNVLFVGVQNLFFDEQLHGMPLDPQFVPVEEGIRNVHPKAGEPAMFKDQYSTAPAEEGIAYALVTHLPGPLRSNDVLSFTSSRSAGYVAAVQWFTDPSLARVLFADLKQSLGEKMPRYYQVLLKVKFRDDVPTETTYVLSRELR